MVRAAVDTNVFISGLLGSPNNRSIINALKEFKFELVTSRLLLEEISSVAARAKFRGVIKKELVGDLADVILEQAFFIKPTQAPNIVPDPADNELLVSAIDSKCSFVVTGDKRLLALESIRGISIVTPKEFLTHIESASS